MRNSLTYANVAATLALFLALGGTSYAVLRVDGSQIDDNTVRSRDLRNNDVRGKDLRNHTVRARDVARNSLGGAVIREADLGVVPRAGNSQELGGLGPEQFKVRCPMNTVARAGVCIEATPRSSADFLLATNICDQAARGLPTMPQLDRLARSSGPLSPQGEWTASVYRNEQGSTLFVELEAVVLSGVGDVSYGRVYSTEQHAFRCVALPSN